MAGDIEAAARQVALVSAAFRDHALGIVRRIGGEPLVLFALPAALMFALYGLLSGPDQATIVVGPDTIEALVETREQALLRPLTEAERAEVIRAHVRDEVLLREALARGLHLSDPQVRERLIDRMRIQLADEPPAPSEADLRAFYEAHQDTYRSEPTVTLEHVFFEEGADPARIARASRRLEEGADPEQLGDRFWLGVWLEGYSQRELGALFGRGFAATVFATEPGVWLGPLDSTRGRHLVRVREISAPETLPFAQLRPYIEADWLAAAREASVDARLEPLRERYRIVIEDEAGR